MSVDFGRAAGDYAKHRAGFPASLWDRLATFGIGTKGQRVVDVGTGTGTLARGFAARGCRVIGIDPSAAMLEQARALDATVDWRSGTAEVTGLDDASVDVLTAGQCWHWFDRPAAAAEARRLLVPGGAIAVCHFDWLPLPGSVTEATEALIVQHNPAFTSINGNGVHGWVARDIGVAGFTDIETFSYDVATPYTHEAWRGRVRACAGVAASTLPPDKVEQFDAAHAAMLAERFPDEPMAILHRVLGVRGKEPRAAVTGAERVSLGSRS